jgi:hypothetical protein
MLSDGRYREDFEAKLLGNAVERAAACNDKLVMRQPLHSLRSSTARNKDRRGLRRLLLALRIDVAWHRVPLAQDKRAWQWRCHR